MLEQLLKHLGIILFNIENTEFSPEEEERRKHLLTGTVNGNGVT